MKGIVTIGRQFGSGGREIGAKLASELGIPFYDHELIIRAAKESGFSETIFENAEKKASNSLLYSLVMGMSSYGVQDGGYSSLSLDDRAYLAQAEVIRKVANEGPCVIVGRCADYILKDKPYITNLFVYADMDVRCKRVAEMKTASPDKIKDEITKGDKSRANYYNYHTGQKWGNSFNYHMSINSSAVGIDGAVKIAKDFVMLREELFNK